MTTTAADIMSYPVISIGAGATLEEVVKILADNNISGLPVTDAENKVIGVITEKDIIEHSGKLHVIPLISSSGWISPYADISAATSFKKGIELLASVKVEQIMSTKVTTIKADTPLSKVAGIMKNRNINRIPVVDKEGKITGIITRANLISCLAERKNQD